MGCQHTILPHFCSYSFPGHQPISYYICTGLDPSQEFKKPIKIYGIVEIGSLIFNIFAAVKIYLFKKSEKSEGKEL